MVKPAVAPIDYPPDILADLVAAEPNAGNFGVALKRLRETAHLSQYALGKKVGCTESTIANYEWGVQFPVDASAPRKSGQLRNLTTVQALARALELPPEITEPLLDLHRSTTTYAEEHGRASKPHRPEPPTADEATTASELLYAYYVAGGKQIHDLADALHSSPEAVIKWHAGTRVPRLTAEELAHGYAIHKPEHIEKLAHLLAKERRGPWPKDLPEDPLKARSFGQFVDICLHRDDAFQRHLAEKIGVNRITITQWIAEDTMPEEKSLNALPAALHLTEDEHLYMLGLYHSELEARREAGKRPR